MITLSLCYKNCKIKYKEKSAFDTHKKNLVCQRAWGFCSFGGPIGNLGGCDGHGTHDLHGTHRPDRHGAVGGGHGEVRGSSPSAFLMQM